MQLPSLGDAATAAQRAALRFPLVLAAGALAAYAGITLTEITGDPAPWVRLLLTSSLGLPLFFALTLVVERRVRDRGAAARHALALVVGLAVLAAVWLAWPRWTLSVQVARYAQLSAAFHLLVAFAPFIGYREPSAFWQYNKALFLRFLTAALFTGVLWLGISGALLALDKLFGVEVPGESYGRLWILLAFVFNSWFFVGGVPDDLAALEHRADYPAGLRVFTQYVLVPIVAIYLLLLTLYLGKVLITREWPSGWIGWLVSSVAGVGMLSWLLVRPLEERAEHAWVKAFTRGFYVALIPAIVMLWLAIWKRVAQYGITERRYFLIVLSLWLAGIALYYTFSRSRSIKLIPATLCAIAVLTFAGPWGAYAVSRASQTGRLEGLLARNGLLVDGALQPATRSVTRDDLREMSAGFTYLLETHGAAPVTPWLAGSLGRTVGAVGRGGRGRAEGGARSIMAAMKLQYVAPWENERTESLRYYAAARTEAVNIAEYTYAIRLTSAALRDSLKVTDGVFLRVEADRRALVVTRGGRAVLDMPLQPMLDSAAARQVRTPNRQVPPDVLTLEVRRGRGAMFARFTQVTGNLAGPGPRLTSLEGEVFLRLP